MFLAAFTSAWQAYPQAVHRKTAWLSRDFGSTRPHAEHCWLVNAGLIFSTTFRLAAIPSSLFGANLIGAMIGGFCEYLSMIMGNQNLMFLVIGAYVASLALQMRLQKAGRT